MCNEIKKIHGTHSQRYAGASVSFKHKMLKSP